MGKTKRRRNLQIIKYGWQDACEISKMEGVHQSRYSLFWDIVSCYRNHYVFSNQYKANRMWDIPREKRKELEETIGSSNKKRDKWIERHFQDFAFLNKYKKFKWQKTVKRMQKRDKAYIKHYNLSDDTKLQYGIVIISEHYHQGKISTGQKILITRNVDIDYTGDLTIGNGVSIAEGTKILTHVHVYLGNRKHFDDPESRMSLTPLTIEDNVFIGAHCIIMPGVGRIGENSMISAYSVVTRPIPPNSMVSGNPAKVTGTISPKMRTLYRYKKE